ncbi:MAG: hypothetical protein ACREPB_07255 [Arenimonas sp.]
MHFRRLRWHSCGRQEALFSRLDHELNRWLGAWSVEPACLSLQSIAAGIGKPAAPLKWLRVNSSKGVFYFGAPEVHLESLGGLLAKASTDDILHLGRRVGDRALKALFSQWMGVAILDIDFEEVPAPSNHISDARFGYAIFSLKGSGFLAYAVLDADLVDSLVPSTPLSLEPLASRDTAFGNEKIELNVVLDLGTSKLADTLGLQVGDVLLSNTSIDSVFQLTHPDMRHLANVRLVRKELQRAVQVDTP